MRKRLWNDAATMEWLDKRVDQLESGAITPYTVADQLLALGDELLDISRNVEVAIKVRLVQRGHRHASKCITSCQLLTAKKDMIRQLRELARSGVFVRGGTQLEALVM